MASGAFETREVADLDGEAERRQRVDPAQAAKLCDQIERMHTPDSAEGSYRVFAGRFIDFEAGVIRV